MFASTHECALQISLVPRPSHRLLLDCFWLLCTGSGQNWTMGRPGKDGTANQFCSNLLPPNLTKINVPQISCVKSLHRTRSATTQHLHTSHMHLNRIEAGFKPPGSGSHTGLLTRFLNNRHQHQGNYYAIQKPEGPGRQRPEHSEGTTKGLRVSVNAMARD